MHSTVVLSPAEQNAVKSLQGRCHSCTVNAYSAWAPFEIQLRRSAARVGQEGPSRAVTLVFAALQSAVMPTRSAEVSLLLADAFLSVLEGSASTAVGSDLWIHNMTHYFNILSTSQENPALSDFTVASWHYASFLFCEKVLKLWCASASQARKEVTREWIMKGAERLWLSYAAAPTEGEGGVFCGVAISKQFFLARILHWTTCFTAGSELDAQLAKVLGSLQENATSAEEMSLVAGRIVFEVLSRSQSAQRYMSQDSRRSAISNCLETHIVEDGGAIEAAQQIMDVFEKKIGTEGQTAEFLFTKAFLLILSYNPKKEKRGVAYDKVIDFIMKRFAINASHLKYLDWNSLSLAYK